MTLWGLPKISFNNIRKQPSIYAIVFEYALSPEMLKARLDGAVGSLIWMVTGEKKLEEGCWNGMAFNVSSN